MYFTNEKKLPTRKELMEALDQFKRQCNSIHPMLVAEFEKPEYKDIGNYVEFSARFHFKARKNPWFFLDVTVTDKTMAYVQRLVKHIFGKQCTVGWEGTRSSTGRI